MANRVAAILIDLSGTIHIEDSVIPGSIEALKRLRKTNAKIKFVTNTTKESKTSLLYRLSKIGFDIRQEEIFTSLSAAKQLIVKLRLRPFLMLSDNAKKDFADVSTEDPNAVVVGLAPTAFNYNTMNDAFRLLMQKDSRLIAIHKGRYYKQQEGLSLGPGAFVSALEYSTGKESTVVGKPEKAFFLAALQEMSCSAHESIMIGDDARDDVAGAEAAGLQGILVKTGKYRDGDEENIPNAMFVARDFAEAVEYVITNCNVGPENIEDS